MDKISWTNHVRNKCYKESRKRRISYKQ